MTQHLQPSVFNLRVPLPDRNEVFLMNTLTDAQLLVSPDVAALLDRIGERAHATLDEYADDERGAIELLRDNGFVVADRRAQRQNVGDFFARVKSDASELHITVLTTMQCNFACDYCYQGDRGDYNKFAEKMTLDTAAGVAAWVERELDRVRPEKLTLMFFGGEPLLNLPVVYYLAERLSRSSRENGVDMAISIITNGLLLTEEVVDRLRAVRSDRRQDHARRRSRHPQPDASAARRPGNVRPHHREHSARGRARPYRGRRQLRRQFGRQLPGAPAVPQRTGLRGPAGEGELQAGDSHGSRPPPKAC